MNVMRLGLENKSALPGMKLPIALDYFSPDRITPTASEIFAGVFCILLWLLAATFGLSISWATIYELLEQRLFGGKHPLTQASLYDTAVGVVGFIVCFYVAHVMFRKSCRFFAGKRRR